MLCKTNLRRSWRDFQSSFLKMANPIQKLHRKKARYDWCTHSNIQEQGPWKCFLISRSFCSQTFLSKKKCRVFSYWISFCINMQPACMKKRLVEFSTALNWSRSLIIFHHIIHLKQRKVWKAFYWISIIWFNRNNVHQIVLQYFV